MALIASLTVPVDRGIGVFKFIMFVFGFIVLFTFSCAIYFLFKQGIW